MTEHTSSKTISFDKIKQKAKEIATERLDGRNNWYMRHFVDGTTRAYDPELAYSTLVPALAHAIDSGRSFNEVSNEFMSDLCDRCREVIDRWDVRQVNRLVDLFPEAVPASCRLRNAVCEYDEHGDWVVSFDLSSRREKTSPSGREEIALNYLAGSGGRLKSLLPEVARGQEVYEQAWRSFSEDPRAAGANDAIAAATANFNKVLERAMYAFYLDTSEYNHWNTIRQVWGPERHGKDPMELWYVDAYAASTITDKLTKVAADLEAGRFEDLLREQLGQHGAERPGERSRG